MHWALIALMPVTEKYQQHIHDWYLFIVFGKSVILHLIKYVALRTLSFVLILHLSSNVNCYYECDNFGALITRIGFVYNLQDKFYYWNNKSTEKKQINKFCDIPNICWKIFFTQNIRIQKMWKYYNFFNLNSLYQSIDFVR